MDLCGQNDSPKRTKYSGHSASHFLFQPSLYEKYSYLLMATGVTTFLGKSSYLLKYWVYYGTWCKVSAGDTETAALPVYQESAGRMVQNILLLTWEEGKEVDQGSHYYFLLLPWLSPLWASPQFPLHYKNASRFVWEGKQRFFSLDLEIIPSYSVLSNDLDGVGMGYGGWKEEPRRMSHI